MDDPDPLAVLAPELLPTFPEASSADWSLTSWKGSRLEQHRAFLALPFRRKLELVEEMCDRVRFIAESRKRQGLPYRDPYTGEIVRPLPSEVENNLAGQPLSAETEK